MLGFDLSWSIREKSTLFNMKKIESLQVWKAESPLQLAVFIFTHLREDDHSKAPKKSNTTEAVAQSSSAL